MSISIYFIPIIHGVMMHNVIQKFVPKKKNSLLKTYSCIPSKYKNKHKINYLCIKGPMITQRFYGNPFISSTQAIPLQQVAQFLGQSSSPLTFIIVPTTSVPSKELMSSDISDPEMKKSLHKTESFRNYQLAQSAQQNTIMYWYNILPRLNYNLLYLLYRLQKKLLLYFGLEINQSNKMNKYNDKLQYKLYILGFLDRERNYFSKNFAVFLNFKHIILHLYSN